jgi:hypothetical protein
MGEVVDANRMASTPYDLSFSTDHKDEVVCEKTLTQDDLAVFRTVSAATLAAGCSAAGCRRCRLQAAGRQGQASCGHAGVAPKGRAPHHSPGLLQAVKDDWYFQMYYDDLPVWGFIGKVEKIIQKSGAAEYKYYVFTHVDFDIKYQGDRVVEINVLTDPHQVRAAGRAAPVPVPGAPSGLAVHQLKLHRRCGAPSGGGHQRGQRRGEGKVQLQRQVDAHHHLL